MTTKSLLFLFFFTVFLINCGSLPPLLSVKGSPVLIGENTNLEAVRDSILKTGARTNWKMKVIKKGHIVASHSLDKYRATVDIFYNTDSYNILYKDSENFGYDGTNIHSRYNRWILNLDRNIRRMQLKIAKQVNSN